MEYLRDSGSGEDDKSAINFHKLILLNLLILCEPLEHVWRGSVRFIALKSKSCEIKWDLCEPKQNMWEMWGDVGIRG